ncbi:hypothetical protein BH24PSE2_BH24PSE2_10990 [soil metagenome]
MRSGLIAVPPRNKRCRNERHAVPSHPDIEVRAMDSIHRRRVVVPGGAGGCGRQVRERLIKQGGGDDCVTPPLRAETQSVASIATKGC